MEVFHQAAGQHKRFVFPGPADDGPLSNMALLMLLRRLKREGVTAHGMRSAFKDWASECTSFPNEVGEMALAHVVENATEALIGEAICFKNGRLNGSMGKVH